MSKQGHSQEQIDRKLQSIESWKDTILRYKKEVQEINDNIATYRWKDHAHYAHTLNLMERNIFFILNGAIECSLFVVKELLGECFAIV